MPETSPSPEDLRCEPPQNGRWYSAMARHATALARRYALGTPGNPDTPDVYEEEEAALHDLMFTPAPSFDLLLVKFNLYRDLFGLTDEVFVDRRELVFLAAIEADVRRLATKQRD